MPKRILLIDDDQDDADTFADALKELPFETSFDRVEDGVKALEKLASPDGLYPDIIFLDINMPILNGWECLREIKNMASLAHIPIIMYSTSNIHNKGLQATDVGATAFMTKPDSFKELKKKLSDLFGTVFQ